MISFPSQQRPLATQMFPDCRATDLEMQVCAASASTRSSGQLLPPKRPSGYRFIADNIRVPHSSATLRRWGAGQAYGGPKSKGRRSPKDSRMRDGQTFRLNPLGCLPTDVWSCAGANTSAGHYAAFPKQLVRTIVEACSFPGDLVLDPFAGSGTTCAVAASLGRRSLGIDLNPEYAFMAEEAASRNRAA